MNFVLTPMTLCIYEIGKEVEVYNTGLGNVKAIAAVYFASPFARVVSTTISRCRPFKMLAE